MCFTYICKLSCDACGNDSNDLLSYYNNYVCSTLNVQQGRRIKMDDVYIYHVHTLSLLLACLQNKHRRGRLYFQEREDDVDMSTADTTKYTTRRYIYQVNSSSNYVIYNFNSESQITTSSVLLCRFRSDLFKPRVKMRTWIQACKFNKGECDRACKRWGPWTCMRTCITTSQPCICLLIDSSMMDCYVKYFMLVGPTWSCGRMHGLELWCARTEPTGRGPAYVGQGFKESQPICITRGLLSTPNKGGAPRQ